MSHETVVLREIGEALARLRLDVTADARELVATYRLLAPAPTGVEFLKQAIDAPHRAKARIQAWMTAYDARPGNTTGDAQALFVQALQIYGVGQGNPLTLAEINADLNALETAALQLVALRNGGATWDEVATQAEAMLGEAAVERISLRSLPIPTGYTTVWGEPPW